MSGSSNSWRTPFSQLQLPKNIHQDISYLSHFWSVLFSSIYPIIQSIHIYEVISHQLISCCLVRINLFIHLMKSWEVSEYELSQLICNIWCRFCELKLRKVYETSAYVIVKCHCADYIVIVLLEKAGLSRINNEKRWNQQFCNPPPPPIDWASQTPSTRCPECESTNWIGLKLSVSCIYCQ